MERRYQGVLKFKRFFGVKAGRSIWKESFVKTRVYADSLFARYELEWLRDYVIPHLHLMCVAGLSISSLSISIFV